jgi:hypothetical protein
MTSFWPAVLPDTAARIVIAFGAVAFQRLSLKRDVAQLG